MTARRIALVLAVAVLAIVGLACRVNANEAMQSFYENDGPECTLEDPLRRAGSEVVPLVVEAIADKEMPRRRYAISFVGNMADRRGLDALTRIVNDPSERDYFRSDSLEAIQKIDRQLGESLAQAHQSAGGQLGDTASAILQGYKFKGYGIWGRIFGRACD